MRSLGRISCVVVLLFVASRIVSRAPLQAAAPEKAPAVPAPPPADLQQIVTQQFGPDFKIVTKSPSAGIVAATAMGDDITPWSPLFTGDLNGDGSEDAVIIARNKNAVIGAKAYHYKVVDAYNDHFGYGNPEVTVDFNGDDPLHNMLLLVIHGAGKEGWRAATPLAKFVLINIPFEGVSLTKGELKHRTVDAIRVEESDTVSSVVFWDGKKYRYLPGGGTN